MKRTTILSAILLVALAVFGQKAQIKVMYETKAPSLATKTQKPTKMVLLAGKDGSYYYNTMSQYVDSMNSTPEGKSKLREIQMKAWMVQGPEGMSFDLSKGNAPLKKVHTYIIKDENNSIVYGEWADEHGYYAEPKNEQQWTIVEDSTQTVLGYECVMATMDYHGRKWKAWFTTEIPVSDGPWKFCGLPGLILKVEDNDNLFHFIATGLESVDMEMPSLYMKNEYSEVDRKAALRDNEQYRANMEANLRARFNTTVVKHVDDNGNEVAAPVYKREIHAIEPDF